MAAPSEPLPVASDPVPSPAPWVATASEPVGEGFPDQTVVHSPRTQGGRPLAPLTYRPQPETAPVKGAYAVESTKSLMPLSTRNGPARASLVVSLIGVLVGATVFWWVTDANPTLARILIYVTIGLFGFAFILAIAGLVASVTRPTTKSTSIVALLLSSALTIGVVVLYGLRLIGTAFFATAEVESEVEAWYQSHAGITVTATCPADAPNVDGSVFVCAARTATGWVDPVEVHVVGSELTFQILNE